MPTYEFECPAGHQFENFYRKISDAPVEVMCPRCGKVAERRLSGGGGLIFKGSGFYITDYGKDGKKAQPTGPAASGDAKAESKPGEADTSSSTESKPSDTDSSSEKPAEKKKAAESKPPPSGPKKGSASSE